MFSKGISTLIGSNVDVGNIPSPRPHDDYADRCAQAALRAMQAENADMTLSERIANPSVYARLRKKRREHLEAFLWVEPNRDALECILDLIGLILSEGRWADADCAIDDPTHPKIDVQAAETAMLLAWIMRRHGAKLRELCPNLSAEIAVQLRRRLLAPLSAHDDYPFMRGRGVCPLLILSDLLLSCLMLEESPSRRQQPVKQIMLLLDRVYALPTGISISLKDRLTDACALADLARLLKRISRGEVDMTREIPSGTRLDDILIAWIHADCFFDPAGDGLRPPISGMDVFRLGYLTRDTALSSLGAHLNRLGGHASSSVNGRVLNMEYIRAAQDESNPLPHLRRAAAEDCSLMISRMGGLCAGITSGGDHSNAGDFIIFCDSRPIIADMGGYLHSLPEIDGVCPLMRPRFTASAEADFGRDRDLMSVDLSGCYPEDSGVAVFQRTLMTMRGDGTIRLVDAFELLRQPKEIVFRFVCAQKPMILGDYVRIGAMRLYWDGEMQTEIRETGESDFYLLKLKIADPPRRLICGFRFEECE